MGEVSQRHIFYLHSVTARVEALQIFTGLVAFCHSFLFIFTSSRHTMVIYTTR
jgi:hypothetical protein